MRVYKYFEYYERVDGLIRRKQTGTPQQLANRLKTSERTIYRIIQEMKENGLPIVYDRREQCYKYDGDAEIKIWIGRKNS